MVTTEHSSEEVSSRRSPEHSIPTMSVSGYYMLLFKRAHSSRNDTKIVIKLTPEQYFKVGENIRVKQDGFELSMAELPVIQLGLSEERPNLSEERPNLFCVRPQSETAPIYVLGTEEQVREAYKAINVPGFEYSFDIKEQNVIGHGAAQCSSVATDFVNCLAAQQDKGGSNSRALQELEVEIQDKSRQIKLLKDKKDKLARVRETISSQVISKCREMLGHYNLKSPAVSEEEDESFCEAEEDVED